MKGDISVLAKYTQVKKVDFNGCKRITGECRVQSKEISWSFLFAFFGMFLTILALPATRTHHVRTGDIQVLKNCPNVTSLNFENCSNIHGEHTLYEHQSAFF